MKIKKSNWFRIYPKKGKTNISQFQGKSGAYIIKKSNKIIYIGSSSYDLYKTITRHFQTWNDNRPRITYPQKPEYRVRIILCSPTRAHKIEKALILKYRPKDNELKYELFQDEKDKWLDEIDQADEIEVPF